MSGPLIITAGAILECNKGAAPMPLKGIPQNRVFGLTGPVANIMDNKSVVNIGPFGKCDVVKPPICVPTFIAPWSQGCTSVMIGGFPALTKDSKCLCALGGEVKIAFPGPPKSKIP